MVKRRPGCPVQHLASLRATGRPLAGTQHGHCADAHDPGAHCSEQPALEAAPATVCGQLVDGPQGGHRALARSQGGPSQSFWRNGRLPLCRESWGLLGALCQDLCRMEHRAPHAGGSINVTLKTEAPRLQLNRKPGCLFRKS